MTQRVQAHILDAGLAAHRGPQREIGRPWTAEVAWGGKDERTGSPGLSLEDAPGLRIEVHLPRAGLGIGKGQRVGVHLGPAKREDFVLSASGQKQQPDDVGLLPGRCGALRMVVEGAVQPVDFLARKKAGKGGTPIRLDGAGGVDVDVAAGDGEVQYLAKKLQRAVGAAWAVRL